MTSPDSSPEGPPDTVHDGPPEGPPDTAHSSQPGAPAQPSGRPRERPTGQPVPQPPGHRPTPGPPRRPTIVPTAPAVPPAPEAPAPPAAASPEELAAREWGRVDDEGTVFVRTPDGERPVGQMPDAAPAEALAFFTKRYTDLAFEVELLERRVRARALTPDEAAGSVKQVHATVRGAQAVGDLDGLDARLDALTSLIEQQRE